MYILLNKFFPSKGAWQDFQEIDESDFKPRTERTPEYESDAETDAKLKDRKGSDASVNVKEVA